MTSPVPPLPTRAEVTAHARDLGLLDDGGVLSRDTYRRLARDLHEAARAMTRPGPDDLASGGRVASRVVHDAGDHYLVVTVSTVPKGEGSPGGTADRTAETQED